MAGKATRRTSRTARSNASSNSRRWQALGQSQACLVRRSGRFLRMAWTGRGQTRRCSTRRSGWSSASSSHLTTTPPRSHRQPRALLLPGPEGSPTAAPLQPLSARLARRRCNFASGRGEVEVSPAPLSAPVRSCVPCVAGLLAALKLHRRAGSRSAVRQRLHGDQEDDRVARLDF